MQFVALAIKYWKPLATILICIGLVGTAYLVVHKYNVTMAENESLKVENQRQADELAYQKILTEKIQKANAVKSKNVGKVKNIAHADRVKLLDSNGWLRH